MNKKILLVSILAVFMLVAISFATAVSSNTTTTKGRESPLYKIRTNRAIKEKIGEIISNYKGERLFYLPFTFFPTKNHFSVRDMLINKCREGQYSTGPYYTFCR